MAGGSGSATRSTAVRRDSVGRKRCRDAARVSGILGATAGGEGGGIVTSAVSAGGGGSAGMTGSPIERIESITGPPGLVNCRRKLTSLVLGQYAMVPAF